MKPTCSSCQTISSSSAVPIPPGKITKAWDIRTKW